MKCKDRNGNFIENNDSQDKLLRNLYETKGGRNLLKILTRRFVSDLGGFFLNTRLSTLAIDSFIKNNNIDISEYDGSPYKSYNDFFIRKIKDGARTIDNEPTHFISPCDSKLTVYKIYEGGSFNIKSNFYTFLSLTRSKALSEKFAGGYLLIFRLSVDDYHRYSYVDNGLKSKNYTIDGCYHTVNPIASDIMPIYQENQREYSVLKSENFGEILMMEVGAMMVGKIVNYHGVKKVKRGMEKGRFEFGGSTVILAVQKDKIKIDEDIIINSFSGVETKVKLGEKIGESL